MRTFPHPPSDAQTLAYASKSRKIGLSVAGIAKGYELCFYCWKEGAAHKFFGPNNVLDLWEVKKLHSSRMVHLTEKPVELAVRAIQYSSKPGENVLEIFGGSGSTLIACEQTGRKCFCMELDELYCDVIVRRWEEFTGKKAVRLP